MLIFTRIAFGFFKQTRKIFRLKIHPTLFWCRRCLLCTKITLITALFTWTQTFGPLRTMNSGTWILWWQQVWLFRMFLTVVAILYKHVGRGFRTSWRCQWGWCRYKRCIKRWSKNRCFEQRLFVATTANIPIKSLPQNVEFYFNVSSSKKI